MSPARLQAPVVLGTLAAGGVAFLATSRPWIDATVSTDGLPTDRVAVSGADAQPVISALALVVVTSGLAVLASSKRVRRVVGGLLVLVGIGAVVLIAVSGPALDDALAGAVRDSPAFTGGSAPGGGRSILWPVVAGLAFVTAAGLGVVVLRFGARWSTMGSRYDSPAARPSEPRTSSDLWTAMDEGRDPTE